MGLLMCFQRMGEDKTLLEYMLGYVLACTTVLGHPFAIPHSV